MSEYPHIENVVIDSTIHHLIQVGVLKDSHLHVSYFQQAPPPVEPLEVAAHKLAETVLRQWREEANAWDITKPVLMRVRWNTSRLDADHPHVVGGEVAGTGDRVGTMAEAFLGLRHRRLILLGGAGSGKSTLAVLLALDLLNRRFEDGDRGPVPVVLSLETWNPERDHLHSWLTRRITEDHPGLPRVDGRHPAARLVSDRRILPVLDGLDELPAHRRAAVVQALRRALAAGDPLILTSRPDAYREATDRVGSIGAAAAVEALPVTGEDAAAYLEGITTYQHAERWAPVVEELRELPPEPVAVALSNPLVLWLAGRVYEAPHTDPGELVDTARFPTSASIEDHLLDRLVPAVFTPIPHAPDRLHAPRPWNPVRARRWLGFLAAHLTARRTTEFAWWRLHRTGVTAVVAVPVLLALCGVIGWSVERARPWLLDGPASGPASAYPGAELAFQMGLIFAGLLLLVRRFWFRSHDDLPRRFTNPLRLGAALRSSGRLSSVGRGLRAASTVLLSTAVLSAAALALPYSPAFLTMTLCSTLVAPLLLAVVSAPSDTEDAATPDELLRDERRALLLSLTTIAPVIGVGQGAVGRLVPGFSGAGAAWALFGWFGASVVLVLFSPWSLWLLAKVWLAVLDRVPLHLMEFLRDARAAGLLQRGGSVYRFRSLRIQEHFAGRREAPPARPPGARGRAGVVLPGPRPERPGPPWTSLRQEADAIDRTPLAGRPRWNVREDADGFRAWGHHRGFTVSHWGTIVRVSPLLFIIFAMDGSWHAAFVAVEAAVAFGVLVTLATYLRRTTLDLRLDRAGLSYTVRRHSGRVPWRDIAFVEVSKISTNGWKGSTYGVVIGLHPGAEEPHRFLRTGDLRYVVLPLMALTSSVPSDLESALARFAGELWNPPSADIERRR